MSSSKGVTILDGGMSRELMRIEAPFGQPEWSALALMQAPAAVQQVHSEFVAAGAKLVTTDMPVETWPGIDPTRLAA